MYDDLVFATGRFRNTITRDSKGVPVYVLNLSIEEPFLFNDEDEPIGGLLNAEYAYLTDKEMKYKTFGDIIEFNRLKKYNDLLDNMVLSSPPLGYCNLTSYATYASRLAKRESWKQGINYNNLHFKNNGKDSVTFEELSKTILGEYPTILEAIKLCKEEKVSSVAFSRNFALNSGGKILYRGREDVGVVDFNRKNISLYEDKFFLKELLQEESGDIIT